MFLVYFNVFNLLRVFPQPPAHRHPLCARAHAHIWIPPFIWFKSFLFFLLLNFTHALLCWPSFEPIGRCVCAHAAGSISLFALRRRRQCPAGIHLATWQTAHINCSQKKFGFSLCFFWFCNPPTSSFFLPPTHDLQRVVMATTLAVTRRLIKESLNSSFQQRHALLNKNNCLYSSHSSLEYF